jgi:hypothetical protein
MVILGERYLLAIDKMGGLARDPKQPSKYAAYCPVCKSESKHIILALTKPGEFEIFAECGCDEGVVKAGLERVAFPKAARNGKAPADEMPPLPEHPPPDHIFEPPPDPVKTKPRPSAAIYTADHLLTLDLPAPREIVPGFIYEGFNLFAGKGKTGKSWYALDVAISVAEGGRVFGSIPVEQADVLYLALEDTQRRMKKRLLQRLHGAPPPPRLFICHEWPRIGEGCLRKIRAWLDEQPKGKLVLVDVMKKIKPIRGGNRGVYDDDFDFAGQLKEIADEYAIAMVGITHTRKAAADDVFDEVNASSGLTGAADAIVVWHRKRGDDTARLSITGRDVEEEKADESAVVLQWNKVLASWTVLGSAGDLDMSEERKQIIGLLLLSSESLGPAAIAKALGKNDATTRVLLMKMLAAGEINKAGYGKYVPSEESRAHARAHELYPPINSVNNVNDCACEARQVFTDEDAPVNGSEEDEDDHSERWQ